MRCVMEQAVFLRGGAMRQRRKNSKVQNLIIFLSALLVFNLAALVITVLHNKEVKSVVSTVEVPDNYISPENKTKNLEYLSNNKKQTTSDTTQIGSTKDTDIILYKDHQEDNIPFNMQNMFPGDSETRYFKVKVFYKNNVIVHYRAKIRTDDADLADELNVKVVMHQDGEEMYNGAVSNMPESLTYQLSSTKSTSLELEYEITAYLDTSAGNEFQNRDVAIDFQWWVEETENLEPAQKLGLIAKTQDQLKWMFVLLIMGISGVLILLLIRKKRKGGKGYG